MFMFPYECQIRKINSKLRKEEKGAVMILFAFMLVVLMGFAALALDFGMVYLKRGQLQQAVDTAARAGSIILEDPNLDDTQRNILYKATVDKYMQLNGFDPSELDYYDTSPDARGRGAKVVATCPVEYNFARVFGFEKTEVTCKTVAKTTIEEPTHRKITVDVAFVLDLSGSMFNDSGKRDSKFIPMIDAVNTAVNIIQNENNANRIAISVFGDDSLEGSKKVTNLKSMLPVVSERKIDGVTYKYQKPNVTKGFPYIYLGRYAYKDGEGMNIVVDGGDDFVHLQRSTATFTQYGIQMGAQLLKESTNDGVIRIPSLFLMSDGECTYAYNDQTNYGYKDVPILAGGKIDHKVGWGNASIGNRGKFEYSHELSNVGLYTIEAACYWKSRLATVYTKRNNESTQCRFFCLGYKLDDTVDKQFAQAVLNPATLQSVTATGDNLFDVQAVQTSTVWKRYWNGRRWVQGWVEQRENVTIYIPKPALMLKQKLTNQFDPNLWTWTNSLGNLPYKNDYPIDYNYADWYQEASDGNQLKDALSEFANEVVIPSKRMTTYLVE
ncbi:MAG: TadE/TadG family protein [Lachnospiraceae bacterium]|nr:TadE/TadG family protein [Lachnospiraceae bacterium]